MDINFGKEAYEWLTRAIGVPTQHLNIERMKGSTSSSVFLVAGSQDSHSQKFVLRVLNNQEWLAEEPNLAEHEAAALTEAQKTGLQAPEIVAYSTNDVGFGVPVVLMSFLEGKVELLPSDFSQWLKGLAGQAALIHQHTAEDFPWCFSSWVDRANLTPPAWTKVPHLWERAIELVLAGDPDSSLVFIHRDYHPANVLWDNEAVSGVVDWINACRGPAGVDVAHCRTNLANMFGTAAADEFLDAYLEVAKGFAYDPYWDIDSILDMCLPQPNFYPPWQEFGLSLIAPEVLQQRIDAYLESVIRRL